MRIWAETVFILHNPLGLQNKSVFPEKLFLVRMRAGILQNLADTAIREAIACCIHILRLGKGFVRQSQDICVILLVLSLLFCGFFLRKR
jgi:hypothetical protein